MRGPAMLQPLQQPQEAAHIPPVRGGGAGGRGVPAAEPDSPRANWPLSPPEPEAWRAGRGRQGRCPAAAEAARSAAEPLAEARGLGTCAVSAAGETIGEVE